METLGQKQERFSVDLARLILYAHEAGYGVRMGECYRSEAEARRLAAEGKGIVRSLHRLRLAADLILAVQGRVVWDGEPYQELAYYWRALGEDHCWGGDFRRRDVYHFSIAHGGRK